MSQLHISVTANCYTLFFLNLPLIPALRITLFNENTKYGTLDHLRASWLCSIKCVEHNVFDLSRQFCAYSDSYNLMLQ